MKFTTYLRRKYRRVYWSYSRPRAMIRATILDRAFKVDYGKKPGSIRGNVVFIDNVKTEKGTRHDVYVRVPEDRYVCTKRL
jgi:hypothetical protein